ncbi:phytanoyl-CoA dioxygenase family protein [Sphingomonas sp.]|uniref:phytanoyl-CoA dioxygenase family protein n=1 Tax=Sphingomonas sp. TaxID=28214 RepID=UPI001B2350A8|nr:phytanoyl-CoA dioxygenase family protein [Sphingomonas sp.]MBO9711487.1 phytanoyl-CoA dioxygenase family protein [Sphingomonas sp.]
MIELQTPRGLPVAVPETLGEDVSPRFAPDQAAAIRAYYDENGYVIVKGLIEPATCDAVRALWDSEVKPYKGFMYRQATAKAERHVVNENGWVMNPVLNLQSVDPRGLGRFRDAATQRVLTHPGLVRVFSALLGDSPKLVQSMYFEGNSATWEHQDSYYLDSVNVGTMAAAWVAMEDIHARAGRFFICPRSHKLQVAEHGFANNIADNHEEYIQSVVRKIRELGYEIRAPKLDKGDVLFWNAWTIHGSLDSQDAEHSRSSITAHMIAARDNFLQLQMREHVLPTTEVNGVQVFRPKDLSSGANRSILWVESTFPKAFYAVKRAAVRSVAKRKKA